MSRKRLFVFGSLKKGFSNHWRMGASRFVGNGTTLLSYPLIVTTRYSPHLLKLPDFGTTVEGEIYDVYPSTLKKLDDFEKGRKRAPTLIINHDAKGKVEQIDAYFSSFRNNFTREDDKKYSRYIHNE